MKMKLYFLAKMTPCLWLRQGGCTGVKKWSLFLYQLWSPHLHAASPFWSSCPFLFRIGLAWALLSGSKPGSPQVDAWPRLDPLSSCSQEVRLGTGIIDSLSWGHQCQALMERSGWSHCFLSCARRSRNVQTITKDKNEEMQWDQRQREPAGVLEPLWFVSSAW